jgi:hypothetical protein
MLSKVIHFAKTNFHQKNVEILRKSRAIRWFTTENQPPKPAPITQPPKPTSATPPSASKPPVGQPKADQGKSKGPVTWKSLGYAALFGAGVLVS